MRSVWQKIAATRPIAYATVMTSMARLAQKGILATDAPGPSCGPHGYRYKPALSRSDLMQAAVTSMWDELGATEAERRQFVEALQG